MTSADARPNNLAPRPGERVRDRYGEIRCMAFAEGYVMCLRKRAMPFVMPVAEWRALKERIPPVEYVAAEDLVRGDVVINVGASAVRRIRYNDTGRPLWAMTQTVKVVEVFPDSDIAKFTEKPIP